MSFRRPPPPPTAQQTTRLNSVLSIGFARKQAEIATNHPETPFSPWEKLVSKAIANAKNVLAGRFWGEESENAVKELCYLLTKLDTSDIPETAQDDLINMLQKFLETNELAFWKSDAYATAENATGENGGKPNIVDMCTMVAETIESLKENKRKRKEPPALVRQPGRSKGPIMFA